MRQQQSRTWLDTEMPRWTAERNAEFARRYKAGESFESILKSCSLERHALRMALKSEGCVVRTKTEAKFRGSLSEWHRQFGLMISELLIDHDLERRQVAMKLGMSLNQLVAICRGEYDITIRQLLILCDWFGLEPSVVFAKFLEGNRGKI